MMRSVLLVAVLLGCSAPATSNPQSDQITIYEQEAKEVTEKLLKELGSALKKQMTEGDPKSAIDTCSELAPEIVNRISIEKGWRVTRVGTRVRNPHLGMPDNWEQKAFDYFQR